MPNPRILKLQDNPKVKDVFSRLVSGKSVYETIIEKRYNPGKCKKCGTLLEGTEKFCPECGEKLIKEDKEVNPSEQSSS